MAYRKFSVTWYLHRQAAKASFVWQVPDGRRSQSHEYLRAVSLPCRCGSGRHWARFLASEAEKHVDGDSSAGGYGSPSEGARRPNMV